MFKYNNNHIFTGYLKQLLSSFSLPACKVYSHDFTRYFERYGKEDPRILTSFDANYTARPGLQVNYLKNNELCQYVGTSTADGFWEYKADAYYTKEKFIPGLTRRLNSPGINYDTKTHEYLGDFLRFIRDYYGINLMSLYNCFTDKIYSNVYFPFVINPATSTKNKQKEIKVVINANEPEYNLYALPVKLFANYTVAVDCDKGIEMFCGLYNTNLDTSTKAQNLAARTYQKVNRTIFSQPFLYTKLDVANWPESLDFEYDENGNKTAVRSDVFTRWDLTAREKDLKLFIKVPVSCRSSITILEGDFRSFNDTIYNSCISSKYETEAETIWRYDNNLKTLVAYVSGEPYVLGKTGSGYGIGPIKASATSSYIQFELIDSEGAIVKLTNSSASGKYKPVIYQDGNTYYIKNITGYFEVEPDRDNSTNVTIIPVSGTYGGYHLCFEINSVTKYINITRELLYQNNHSVLNFNTAQDGIDLNSYTFKPISQLQLLAFNTGESYPFADRLVEYLGGSAITPLDEIPDNIKRVQRVMNQNQHYFKIDGLWENKMQNILYDYVMNSGPIRASSDGQLIDERRGYHRGLGQNSKSTLFDVLGFVDKDVEKWYASWKKENNKAVIETNIQNVDIYNGLYDI